MNQSVGWKRISMLLLSALAINPVSAFSDRQLRDIDSGRYPISHPFTLVTGATPKGNAHTFVDICVSSQVTDPILAFDFVPYLV